MKKYLEIARGIADFLAKNQTKKGFPLKNYYGETYSILVWSFFNKKYKKNINEMFKIYRERDKNSKYYLWEFNNYALQEYFMRIKDKRALRFIYNIKFSQPFIKKVTNLILLRSLVRLRSNKKFDRILGLLQALFVILYAQSKKGQFFDNRVYKSRQISYQYHSFSSALVGEIYLITRRKFFKKRFLRAINFIVPKIKKNGRAIYKGRGKEQIFGYGSLIFSLNLAYKLTNNKKYYKLGKKVFNYLLKFRRKDGSFPLVLNKKEQEFTIKDYKKKRKIQGWYSYNNLFDYLPFLGYYIIRSYETLTTFRKNPTNFWTEIQTKRS